MKSKISALMDGELDNADIADTIAQIKKTEELRNEWATYHLIGDTLRQPEVVPIDIASNVSKRLATEPTVLAPRPPTKHKGRVFALSVAASMMTAVAVVVWMSMQTMDRPLKPITDKSVLQAAVQAEPTIISASIPVPAQINDYLLAHGEFSPRTAMHGAVPYIRTVADSDKRSTR
ncbi:MAG: sigma-E factor negative regulatory protein [Proteobacteria bacterium]|nr:sigma-E factor negative regulatory protein [Pseudomonadota bacterium]